MALSDDATGLLLVITLVVTAVLLAVVVALLFRLSRLQRAYAAGIDPDRREDLFEAVGRLAGDLTTLRGDLATIDGNTEHLRDLLSRTTSRNAVVRYDAFEDMGGALSFSAAFLDEHGDGLVISAINGRSETRCYAKSIHGLKSTHNLTDEELEALRNAVEASGTDREAPKRKRVRGQARSQG